MRIAVAGKGGSGKTTIGGVLARSLGRQMGHVLAIDGDSNPNLALTLGFSRDQADRITPLPRGVLEQYADLEGKAQLRLALPIEEVLAKFSVAGPDGVRLLVMGRVDHAGVGWMCRAHATVRELMGKLVEEVTGLTVADLEAGLEDFSRGTPRHSDTLLVVVEPYYKSLETGRRIVELARELSVARVLGVANKVRSKDDEAGIRRFAQAHQFDLAAVVPQDEAVLEADRQGCSPIDLAPEAPAVRAIQALANSL